MKKIVFALPALLFAGTAVADAPAAVKAPVHKAVKAAKSVVLGKDPRKVAIQTAPVSAPVVDKNVVDDETTTALNKVEDTKKHTKKHHAARHEFKEGRGEETFTACAMGEEHGKACRKYHKALKHAVPGMQPVVNPADVQKWEKAQVSAVAAPVAPAKPAAPAAK